LADRDNLHQLSGEHPCQVMIVDEQDVFRRKIRDILHGIGGFQVVAETTSCRMALEIVTRVQINLVIAGLADDEGIKLTTRLKQLSMPPHVIIFSPTMSDSALMQVILAGADGYLMKDTPPRDIIRAFKNFEHGGPAMQPSVTTNVMRLLVERCKTTEEHLTCVLTRDIPSIDPMPVSSTSASAMSSLSFPGNGTAFSNGSHLSPQEEKVFALLRQGQRNKQIAAQLAISHYTVGKHVQNILRKLGAANRTQAAAYPSFEG